MHFCFWKAKKWPHLKSPAHQDIEKSIVWQACHGYFCLPSYSCRSGKRYENGQFLKKCLTNVEDSHLYAKDAFFSCKHELSAATIDVYSLYTVSQINYLTHRPKGLVDEKIHQPSIFLPAKIVNCLFVSRIHLCQYISRYYVEYKLKEETRAKFETKLF